MHTDGHTFKIFLKDLFIEGEKFQYYDVSIINEEKYGKISI